ncbi:hypothetical protein EYF80_006891 [Liparis tanakae]|uniref:Uncharacterized protein n=1 Tax=Liparis tanakae TaxID=230148 RepID=A0A4Z2IZF3_9TELE|nr:hypothetical protein EYF80_006891 [Liparis tanakae]
MVVRYQQSRTGTWHGTHRNTIFCAPTGHFSVNANTSYCLTSETTLQDKQLLCEAKRKTRSLQQEDLPVEDFGNRALQFRVVS